MESAPARETSDKMKRVLLAVLLAAALPAVAGPSGLSVKQRIAGPDAHWDYASFDPARRRVYVAHGDSVLMIEVDSGKVSPDFAKGSHLHAVVPVPGIDRIVTTNSGDHTVKVNDAATGALLASIPGPDDADSAVYDPGSGDVVVIGGDDGVVQLIDPKAMKAVGEIKVGGKLEFAVADGKGQLYINAEDTNEIVVVDLKAGKVTARYAMPGCQRPTGLAFVAGDRLVSSCNGLAEILSAADGKFIASLPIGAGPDAVIYDNRRELALIPSGRAGALAVIALTGPKANQVIDTVPTQPGARTGAVDPKTGRIFLPTMRYAPPVQAGGRPTPVPGSFEVLVLDR
jgi:DNA-binding beta-propeller fold protein YncE